MNEDDMIKRAIEESLKGEKPYVSDCIKEVTNKADKKGGKGKPRGS